ncbi:unnamed protein product [Macrosiphum euphorbiae]|uniref:THAP-type domain-containing protein n=1 Tax=Macrosiphum euphorbiae TaxID=13131 RepID=A0AAV0XI89_9HEMI|nr:unnamed protein product [Macrosiphum euphorbiae]
MNQTYRMCMILMPGYIWYKKVLYHMLDITTWNSYFICTKHFNTNLSFKQFRDQLIKNLIGLPMQTTATDLFKIKKTKTQAPENNHYAVKIAKDKHTLKIAFSVTKLEYENKHHFNVKSVANLFVLGNVLKNGTIIINEK